ncbi:hypothetical protein CXG50_03700 [Pseudomonas plecoglossicida]|uniref:Uncharacterized protein n=1 Tax=Pseudomonas plecoglossicida TaxID=70775 RepID=A0ABX4TXE1_PSEDL|nr:hypothetical protein CSW00_21665 [Pseudomonas sp. MR 02]PLP94641.1 hypothetical protein CX682_02745 [Pseudomonas sp. FFUP_PS_41]PLU85595.1 hypothetical protein CXG44_19760 [Pseudomonas plecoglossicida]TXI06632.1 MAG: hypothetical protein E6Q70_07450 [Pseudomonas monteilii]PLU91986.1 hypothetical protein CXG45_16660 [Pseudomonas plecoglossicida]
MAATCRCTRSTSIRSSRPPGTSCAPDTLKAYPGPVGAALCRDRAAKQPQGFSTDAQIAGAALQPYRDTRPLLQGPVLARRAMQD